MPISKYCATEFPPKYVGSIYALINPEHNNIFYIGKTTDTRTRLSCHLAEARSERKQNDKKKAEILEILNSGKVPIMKIIEEIPIRTKYDKFYYDSQEFHWIKELLGKGFELVNIRVSDNISSEVSLRRIIESAKLGSIEVDMFYFGIDEKGYPIYDQKKILSLGYSFSEDQYASHWAYIIETEKYKDISEPVLDYVYDDVPCESTQTVIKDETTPYARLKELRNSRYTSRGTHFMLS